MIIGFEWLKTYLKLDLPIEKISEILTDIGLEVEGMDETITGINVAKFKQMIEGAVKEFPNFKATATTLRECTCEFDMLWKPGDAGFEAIKDAYLTSTTLRLAALTGAKSPDGIASVAGSEGVLADFSITIFSRSEPLEEGITVSVTAKLSVFDQWIEDGLEAA